VGKAPPPVNRFGCGPKPGPRPPPAPPNPKHSQTERPWAPFKKKTAFLFPGPGPFLVCCFCPIHFFFSPPPVLIFGPPSYRPKFNTHFGCFVWFWPTSVFRCCSRPPLKAKFLGGKFRRLFLKFLANPGAGNTRETGPFFDRPPRSFLPPPPLKLVFPRPRPKQKRATCFCILLFFPGDPNVTEAFPHFFFPEAEINEFLNRNRKRPFLKKRFWRPSGQPYTRRFFHFSPLQQASGVAPPPVFFDYIWEPTEFFFFFFLTNITFFSPPLLWGFPCAAPDKKFPD